MARQAQGRDRPRPKAVRNIGGLPRHLPREDVVIEPVVTACPCCQGTLHRIGEDISEMLDIVPAILRVKRIRRPRYGCRTCESAVVQAPAPPRPVEGGLPTSALLAHVAVSKFAWHLPLHRQAQMLAGHGIDLDRSTLVRWIRRAARHVGREGDSRAGGVVAAAAACAAGADRDDVVESFLRRHAAAGAGSHAKANADRPIVVLCRG